MADDFYYTDPGSGGLFAAPEVSGKKYQAVLLADPTTPTYRAKVNSDGTQDVRGRREIERIVATPTVSTTPAYTAGDAVGGVLQFANAARSSGGAGEITNLTVTNKAGTTVTILPAQLHFFDRTFTHPGDNVAWNPSDADMLNYLGSIWLPTTHDNRGTSGVWTNNIPAGPFGQGQYQSLRFPFVLSGTDLFAALVTGATPTLVSTSDIQVAVTVEKL